MEGQKKFKALTNGKCYNCCSKDDRHAQCREPTRCRKCEGSGHFAARCSNTCFPTSNSKPLVSTHRSSKPPPSPHSRPPGHSTDQSLDRRFPGPQGMERRMSFGGAAPPPHGRRDGRPRELELEALGSAVNYPGNPHFRPHFAFKIASTSTEMEDHRQWLTNLALLSLKKARWEFSQGRSSKTFYVIVWKFVSMSAMPIALT